MARRQTIVTDLSFSSRISPQELAVIREFTKETPVRVGALAHALGLKVVVAALPISISGLIQPDGESDRFVIKVNRFEPKERQRFTIAHEIAHYLLHRDRINSGVIDSVLYRSKLTSRAEAEANRLAADILMPHAQIREAIKKGIVSKGANQVDELAQLFNVSRQAMDIRTG